MSHTISILTKHWRQKRVILLMLMSLFLFCMSGCEADNEDTRSDEMTTSGESISGEGGESTSTDPGELSWGNAEGEYARISGTLRAEDSERARGRALGKAVHSIPLVEPAGGGGVPRDVAE